MEREIEKRKGGWMERKGRWKGREKEGRLDGKGDRKKEGRMNRKED